MSENGNYLTSSQLDFYLTNGYLRIPAVLPPVLLQKLQDQFDDMMFHHPDASAMVINVKEGKSYISNIENLCCKSNLACLELLGYPIVMKIAEDICGSNYFPVQDFAVIKMLGDDQKVLWHQDMLNKRCAPSFTMGIYLDRVDANDGALRVVAGSHLSGKNICELQHETFTEMPMEAGDVLIHDMMLAHSSEPLQKNSLRRVIYFEFLATELVRQENIYGEELIRVRTLLQYLAWNYFRQLHPDDPLYDWKNEQAVSFEPASNLDETLKQVYSKKVNAPPSAYCFEGLW